MRFDQIRGHQRPIRVLRRALASGRIPHAYLFWGPDGVGKELTALAVAQALLCPQPRTGDGADGCGQCASCRKVDGGTHPDLHLLAGGASSIGVSEVRSLQETLSYQAFERGRRIAIIRDAFRLTREAGNALLKTLEEPAAGTHMFLLVHHRSQLLPTLVSRCQALRFDPIAVEDVRSLLVARGMAPELAEPLAEVAAGCPGAVWQEDAVSFGETEAEIEDLWTRWERLAVGERFSLAADWARDKDKIGNRLAALERIAHRQLRDSAAEGDTASAALRLLGALARTRRFLERNVNTQLALDALFLGLRGGDRAELT